MAAVKKTAKIALEGSMSVQEAAQLQKSLLKAIEKAEIIEINFSGLEDMDISVIQVLYALILEARKKSRQIQFTGVYNANVKRFMTISGFISDKNTDDEKIFTQFTEKVRELQ